MLELINLNQLKLIIEQTRTIAIVGLSPKSTRPSNMVGRYLMEAGFSIIPVNPGQDRIFGLECFPCLKAIPQPIDMVDIFRRAEDVLPIVEEAIAIEARSIWMQEGIVNREAEELAQKAGLQVVMDRCIKIDHAQLF